MQFLKQTDGGLGQTFSSTRSHPGTEYLVAALFKRFSGGYIPDVT